MLRVEKKHQACTCKKSNVKQILLLKSNLHLNMGLSYKKSGVDITKIKQSQKAIGKIISSTHNVQKKPTMGTEAFFAPVANPVTIF